MSFGLTASPGGKGGGSTTGSLPFARSVRYRWKKFTPTSGEAPQLQPIPCQFGTQGVGKDGSKLLAVEFVLQQTHRTVDISTLANLVNAAAVTAGVIFAAVQIHHYRQRRRRDAMLELLRSFQSRDFTSALRRVNTLPDGADLRTIRDVLGPDGADDVFMLGLTWESLGVLLFRREVSLDLMDDLFSGAIIISWRKLHVFVEEDRRTTERNTVWEWFQWLAERMLEREKSVPPVPAHIAHRSWRS